jgi:glucose/arabinose dehydrogenase
VNLVKRALIAAVLAALPCAVFAQIQLSPVISTGLSSPVFVGHAGDGSGRLFIVERAGLVRVLQPGQTDPTTFLDIRSKIKSGGEQGLLGLAFHPSYTSNGRFFVFYTRLDDGTLVIAEYAVSADPNVANTAEKVVLTIPHPTNTNHNGGMLAFGPDGYLYIGVGDGGSANDPPNNAQNVDMLLGKILRINIDPPSGSAPYVAPADNPFFGPTAGRDEIFAFGLRNPWRFSFDRATGQQWVGDVGQGAREEVDTPIANGGNYGWRVYEGTLCTNTDQALCVASNFRPPQFEYAHANGRCSLTGGYVYRGSQNALPAGTYVYGDYCTGEIFAWDGHSQTVLLDTSISISSFGEDQDGELYVVGLGGSIHRIAPAVTCTYAISPSRGTFSAAASSGTITVTAEPGCTWSAVSNDSWITITDGASGTGNGTVRYSVAAYTGKPRNRNGSMNVAGQTFSVKQSR